MPLSQCVKEDDHESYMIGDIGHRVACTTDTIGNAVLNAKESTAYVGYAATIGTNVMGIEFLSGTNAAVVSGGAGGITWITNAIGTTDFGGYYILCDLDSDLYVLKEPLTLTLTQVAREEFIISFTEAELSRSGETAIEAINWLKSSMVELYEIFKNDNKLGPLPQKQLRILEKYIGEKSY